MVSTGSTLAVLIALFLLGFKWTVDVIREWPRKKSIFSHIEEWRSVQESSRAKPMKKALFHPGSKCEVRPESRIA